MTNTVYSVNASLDAGQNITGLIEKLAGQIGTTADKVFPWYVNQASLEGWAMAVVLSCLIVVFGACFVVGGLISKWGKRDNIGSSMLILGGIMCVFFILIATKGIPLATTKILNPQYHAMKAIMEDVGNLVHK